MLDTRFAPDCTHLVNSSDIRRRIVTHLSLLGPLTLAELTHLTGRSPRRLKKHLHLLERGGALVSVLFDTGRRRSTVQLFSLTS